LLDINCHSAEVGFEAHAASFFLGREIPVPSLRPERRTRSQLFLIPAPQVVEFGTKVEL
jgi:hypothetical protein